ncbi:hypothetical protein HXX76_015300 [Chlamydomonas incerta]|uniref:Uncharacterized protein n=1 Tax=Chlamydomonas incerta TaxID=51695 RepID=A0A835SAM6_CHLIN|nr:hypothetical protein HXX76_015300 [Chlamydomonas incerta]|eukprot:KAG2423429.1 hypothetical protein HXX76_015300 [Chlamydomonas incerta]
MRGDASNIYKWVVDDVVSSMTAEFQAAGIDESVLMELKTKWEEKLRQQGLIHDHDGGDDHHASRRGGAAAADAGGEDGAGGSVLGKRRAPEGGAAPGAPNAVLNNPAFAVAQQFFAVYTQQLNQHTQMLQQAQAQAQLQQQQQQQHHQQQQHQQQQQQQQVQSDAAVAAARAAQAHHAAHSQTASAPGAAQAAAAQFALKQEPGRQAVPGPHHPHAQAHVAHPQAQGQPHPQAHMHPHAAHYAQAPGHLPPGVVQPPQTAAAAQAAAVAAAAAAGYPGAYYGHGQIPQHDGEDGDGGAGPSSGGAGGDAGGDGAAAGEEPAAEGDEVLSEDEHDEGDEEEVVENLMIGQFEKVQKMKSRWKVAMRDCVFHINGRDYLFKKCQAEFSWQ